ncbi:hypothetical protein AK812_SmicGene42058 [Symbiodinium microadriaticum]|uniref:Uncharacterized protein n=1 Tax=Symbiodinium microadriaticum TaxID=2951 RepID=A0A1Q9C4J4_SYMMI|nr:hypothetical protein AK812_SmicGene42058 [Symbiodinium microadriaticum]
MTVLRWAHPPGFTATEADEFRQPEADRIRAVPVLLSSRSRSAAYDADPEVFAQVFMPSMIVKCAQPPQVEWQHALEPGGQGFLARAQEVVVDGPLRQPFAGALSPSLSLPSVAFKDEEEPDLEDHRLNEVRDRHPAFVPCSSPQPTMARTLLLALAVMASGQQAEKAKEGPLDDVTWTCASLLIGSVVLSGFLAGLLRWSNKDIRKEAWAMVNTTISTFCAAGIDFGGYRFINYVSRSAMSVLSEKQPEAPDSWWFLSLVFLFTCLAPLILYYRLQSIDEDQHQKLFAWSTLGGHICAFLAILYFGHLQQAKAKVHFEGWLPGIPLSIWVWLLPLLAFVFFDLVMKLIRCRASQDHKHMQAHQAEDALTDASAITVSFLLVQAVCYHMSTECDPCYGSGDPECDKEPSMECEARRFMPITHGEFGNHIDWCVGWLVLLALVACGLMVASILCSLRAQRAAKEEGPEGPDGCGFWPKCIRQTLPATAAWCAQRAGVIGLYGGIEDRMNWYLHFKCKEEKLACPTETMQPHQAAHRTQMANAWVMSAIALIGVFAGVKLADWIKNKIRFFVPEEDAERDTESGSEESESKNVAKSVRKAVTAFGMLMGICWEKASETAFETMLDKRALGILFKNTSLESHF